LVAGPRRFRPGTALDEVMVLVLATLSLLLSVLGLLYILKKPLG